MKKIIISLSIIAAVAAIVVGATTAFFSDTETSTGNTFTAGAIDLTIDNHCWYNGMECKLVATGGEYHWDGDPDKEKCSCTWDLSDLDGHLFFDFIDLKPGDWGEDTISIHVNDNPAWLCADITLTSNDENTCTEPEAKAEGGDCDAEGELADELWFIWWADDGNDVLDSGETVINTHKLSEAWLNQSHTVALADANGNIWEPNATDPTPIETGEGENYYIGKAWCYGDLIEEPGDGFFGFTCNGEPVTNMSQTDSATLDVSFYAVQSRHNEDFVCNGDYYGRIYSLRLDDKDAGWQPISNDTYGLLTFKSPYPTFDWSLSVFGLQANTDYKLIYAPDPWPQSLGGANTEIGAFTTNGDGDWAGSGSIDLGYDIPSSPDTNTSGGKIWVVLSTHHDGTQMTAWDMSKYLFEWNLINYDDSDN